MWEVNQARANHALQGKAPRDRELGNADLLLDQFAVAPQDDRNAAPMIGPQCGRRRSGVDDLLISDLAQDVADEKILLECGTSASDSYDCDPFIAAAPALLRDRQVTEIGAQAARFQSSPKSRVKVVDSTSMGDAR